MKLDAKRLALGALMVSALLPATAAASGPPEGAEPSKLARPSSSGAQSSIVNGTYDTYTDNPWVTYIRADFPRYYVNCTGSLIAPRAVLTAAHCVTGTKAWRVRVRIGSKSKYRGGARRRVKKIFRYPYYNGSSGDMAILKLRRAVGYRPIGLVDQGDAYIDSPAYIAGWGDTSDGGSDSNYLRSTWIWLLEDAQCESRLDGYNGALEICAGVYPYRTYDTCQGDSGGPLALWFEGYGWYLIGVTSWGEGCAAGYPGVYAWVGSSYLRPWIRGVTGR